MIAYKVVYYDILVDKLTSRVESGNKKVYYAPGLRTVPNAENGPLSAFRGLMQAVWFDEAMFIGRAHSEIWECEVEPLEKYPYTTPAWAGSIACTAITLVRKLKPWREDL